MRVPGAEKIGLAEDDNSDAQRRTRRWPGTLRARLRREMSYPNLMEVSAREEQKIRYNIHSSTMSPASSIDRLELTKDIRTATQSLSVPPTEQYAVHKLAMLLSCI